MTIAAADRVRLFNQPDRAATTIQALRDATEKHRAQVFAYCLMPDHIHLLVAPPQGVSLVEFVRLFKQLSAYRLKRLAGKAIAVWQERFYDHALRAEESLEDVANYIWNNPVRAGIVARPEDYVYSGSLTNEGVMSGSEDPDLRAGQAMMSGSEDARPTISTA